MQFKRPFQYCNEYLKVVGTLCSLVFFQNLGYECSNTQEMMSRQVTNNLKKKNNNTPPLNVKFYKIYPVDNMHCSTVSNPPPPEKGEKSIIYAFGLTLLYRDCVIKHSRCWGPAPCDVTKGTDNNNSTQPLVRHLAAASSLLPAQTRGHIMQQNNRFVEREL